MLAISIPVSKKSLMQAAAGRQVRLGTIQGSDSGSLGAARKGWVSSPAPRVTLDDWLLSIGPSLVHPHSQLSSSLELKIITPLCSPASGLALHRRSAGASGYSGQSTVRPLKATVFPQPGMAAAFPHNSSCTRALPHADYAKPPPPPLFYFLYACRLPNECQKYAKARKAQDVILHPKE